MPYTHIIPQNLDGDSGGTILARAATAKEIKSWFLSDPYYLEVKVSRDCKKITYACTGPGVKKMAGSYSRALRGLCRPEARQVTPRSGVAER